MLQRRRHVLLPPLLHPLLSLLFVLSFLPSPFFPSSPSSVQEIAFLYCVQEMRFSHFAVGRACKLLRLGGNEERRSEGAIPDRSVPGGLGQAVWSTFVAWAATDTASGTTCRISHPDNHRIRSLISINS